MTAQPVILPLPSAHARFFVCRLNQLSLDQLKQQLRHMLATRDRLITQHSDADIKTSIAFGPELWQQLYDETPQGLHQLQAEYGEFYMPVEAADLFIHVASARADLCFAILQSFTTSIQHLIDVIDETTCFKYLDSRDLTGFIDGTENPQTLNDRAETALLTAEAGPFANGSFVFAQRYVHNLQQWNTLTVDDQQHVIGRTKLDSIELEDDVKPKTAHISRVVIEDDAGEELEILRHSLPYGNAHSEQGLFFVAYTKDLSIIDRMLHRMYGTAGDHLHDHLLHFVRPVNGAYFFAPSNQLLTDILDAT